MAQAHAHAPCATVRRGPVGIFLLVVVLLPSRRIPIVRGSSSPRAHRGRDDGYEPERPAESVFPARFPGDDADFYVLGSRRSTPAARPTLRRLGPRVTFARVLPVDTGRILHVYTMFDLDKTGKV